MRRARDRGEHLCRAALRGAVHAAFAIGVRERGGPLYSIEAVDLLVLEGVPFAFRSIPTADVLDNDYIASWNHPEDRGDCPVDAFVIGSTHEDDGKFARRIRPIDVRVE